MPLKSLVIGRENWLFSTSTQVAEATAIWTTFIENAKVNHIDSRQYWTDLLKSSTILPAVLKSEELVAYLALNYLRFQNIHQCKDSNVTQATTFTALTEKEKINQGLVIYCIQLWLFWAG